MREEEKEKRGKTERLFSNGIIILVFLILAAQSAFFARYLILDFRSTKNRTEYKAEDILPDTTGKGRNFRTADGTIIHKPTSAPVPLRSGPDTTADSPTEKPESHIAETDKPARSMAYDGWKWDRVELNSADSAALDALPGIGPYYARQIIRYRNRLGYFADISQLLDIRGIDSALLDKLDDRIYIDPASIRKIDFYTMSADSLAAHPYIGPYAAKGLDRLRKSIPRSSFTIKTITESNILPPAQAGRLALYFDDGDE